MRIARSALLLVVGCSLLCFSLEGAAEERCSSTDAAEDALDAVKSWSALRSWQQHFAACDDGDIAEAVSEYVTAGLAKEWTGLSELEREVKGSPDFQGFVLQHIDATADDDDLQAVLANATQHCPPRSGSLCTVIADAAKKALADSQE
jgi:hypothetical protein